MNIKKGILIHDSLFMISFIVSTLNPFLWNNTINLRRLKDRYKGKRCFIMGNGPSLNKTPLEMLKDDYVWGLNRGYLLYERIDWRPQFFTVVDDLVLPSISKELKNIISGYPETTFFFPEKFFYRRTLESKKNIIWFKHRIRNPSIGAKGYFSFNADRYLRVPNTVTITAIQLSVYMGFNPIILIGCDTQYSIPDGTEREGWVFDSGTKEFISGFVIKSKFDNDPNHFIPQYFGRGYKWHYPNVKGMLFGYRKVKEICDKKSIKIFNATVGGSLNIFPRVTFNELF